MDKDWLIIIVGGLEILTGAYIIKKAFKEYDKRTSKSKKVESK